MAGLKVYGVAPLPPGTRCELAIQLNSGDHQVPIHASGEIARCAAEGGADTPCMGIRFLEMDDDSQADLWRVIRYNTPPEDREDSNEGADSAEPV